MNIIITRKVIINGKRHEIEIPDRMVITLGDLKRQREQDKKEYIEQHPGSNPVIAYHWQHEKFSME